jgi:pilus assembly protein Flp/PilA
MDETMTQSTTEFEGWRGIQCRLARTARRFAADCSGATAIEYAILAAGIAIAIAAVVYEIGGKVNAMFEQAVGIFGQ